MARHFMELRLTLWSLQSPPRKTGLALVTEVVRKVTSWQAMEFKICGGLELMQEFWGSGDTMGSWLHSEKNSNVSQHKFKVSNLFVKQ